MSRSIVGIALALFLVGGRMDASTVKPLVEFVSGEKPRIEIFAAEKRDTPVSRYLYGKFTEHLGYNVYNGVWAQVVRNTGFEPATYFARKGEEDIENRLSAVERSTGLQGLLESYKQGVAFMWCRYGEGDVSFSTDEDRINSDTSQKIDVRSLSTPTAGIQQPVYLPLHRTGEYDFSIWAKGTVKDLHISIQALDGRELASTVIGELGESWRKHTAHLTVQSDGIGLGRALVLTLSIGQPGAAWLDQCLLFPSDNLEGFDPDLVRRTRENKLSMLRFPGGNFVSGYNWQDGIGPIDKRPMRRNPGWNQDECNHVGTDEWLAFCRLVDAEPLICVNAGLGTPEEAAQWVEYCNGSTDTKFGKLRAENGHPEPYGVRYWEVGNELYGHWQKGHCTPEEYAERYERFYKAMRAVDPDILFIANGQDPDWNRPTIKRDAPILRSMSTHSLIGSNVPGETPKEDVFRSIMAYPAWFEGRLRDMGDEMAKGGVPDPRLAITELQIYTHDGRIPTNQTLSEALFWAGIVNTSIRLDQLVELITHSALVNHGAGLRKEREHIYANPVYWAQHIYANQAGRWPVRVRITSNQFSVPQLHDLPPVEGVPYLDAVALLNDSSSELNLLVTNRHPSEALAAGITLSDFRPDPEVLIETLAGDYMARNSFENPDKVRIRRSEAQVGSEGMTFSFPPSSLTRLRFRSAM